MTFGSDGSDEGGGRFGGQAFGASMAAGGGSEDLLAGSSDDLGGLRPLLLDSPGGGTGSGSGSEGGGDFGAFGLDVEKLVARLVSTG